MRRLTSHCWWRRAATKANVGATPSLGRVPPPGRLHHAHGRAPAVWTPWRTIVGFGVVSLAGDMVYEGMRSVPGPFLGSLGGAALVVGVITGAGEALALVLRLVSGPLADRSGRYWSLTILGYAMTAVCVPLLAVAPFVGSSRSGVGRDPDPPRARRQGHQEPVEVRVARTRCCRGRARPRVRRTEGAGPGRGVRRSAPGGRSHRGHRRAVARLRRAGHSRCGMHAAAVHAQASFGRRAVRQQGHRRTSRDRRLFRSAAAPSRLSSVELTDRARSKGREYAYGRLQRLGVTFAVVTRTSPAAMAGPCGPTQTTRSDCRRGRRAEFGGRRDRRRHRCGRTGRRRGAWRFQHRGR